MSMTERGGAPRVVELKWNYSPYWFIWTSLRQLDVMSLIYVASKMGCRFRFFSSLEPRSPRPRSHFHLPAQERQPNQPMSGRTNVPSRFRILESTSRFYQRDCPPADMVPKLPAFRGQSLSLGCLRISFPRRPGTP